MGADLLANSQQLLDPECFNEVCRLLLRAQVGFQWSEMMDKPDFDDWITAVHKFTLQIFTNSDVIKYITFV